MNESGVPVNHTPIYDATYFHLLVPYFVFFLIFYMKYSTDLRFARTKWQLINSRITQRFGRMQLPLFFLLKYSRIGHQWNLWPEL